MQQPETVSGAQPLQPSGPALIEAFEHRRTVAAFEAALTSEIAGARMVAIVAAGCARPADLQPAVEAWIADWREHQTEAALPLLRRAVQVAVSQLNTRRVTDAVWLHHHPECDRLRHQDDGLSLVISIPANVPRTLPIEIDVNGSTRTVPAVCARALLDVALGEDPVRFRIETQGKLYESIPEVVPHFVRDHNLKIVSKRIAWRPTDVLRSAVRLTQ